MLQDSAARRQRGLQAADNMRSQYLLNTRRWVVRLADQCSQRASLTVSAQAAAANEPVTDLPELVSWVLHRGGRVDGATLANLAGRDGGSGWGLKCTRWVYWLYWLTS